MGAQPAAVDDDLVLLEVAALRVHLDDARDAAQGGDLKEYQVVVDRGRLRAHAMTLHDVATALRSGLAEASERVHAFSHLSHVYPTGSSLYTTYVFRLADDPEETLERWRRLKRSVSEAIVAGGGTISHQHGVGTDHAPYLPLEKGELGMAALADLARRFDPDGVMNPGKLLAP